MVIVIVIVVMVVIVIMVMVIIMVVMMTMVMLVRVFFMELTTALIMPVNPFMMLGPMSRHPYPQVALVPIV